MNFQIRKATVQDIDEISKLRLELLETVGDVNDQNREEVKNANIKYFLQKIDSEDFIAWIAETENEVIGISGLVFFERPPHGENICGLEAYIMNMYNLGMEAICSVLACFFTFAFSLICFSFHSLF